MSKSSVTAEWIRDYCKTRHVYAIVLVAPNGESKLQISTSRYPNERILGIDDKMLMGYSEIYFHEWPL